MIFVDSNVFIEAFIRVDEPGHNRSALLARQLFRDLIDGTATATTSEAVIAEVLYVMTSPRLYARAPAAARTVVQPIIEATGMRFGPRRRYVRALEIWADRPGLTFVDALTIAYVEQGDVQLASFDRQLLASPGVTAYWQG